VETATQVSEELLSQMGRLLPQLSSRAAPLERAHLEEMVGSPSTVLFLARQPTGGLVGMLTLATYRVPTGVHAVIEDVVVDESARGSGIGSALVSAALQEAARRGATNVDLTSRPERQAANRLYAKLGFERRQTNVYRYALG
jgi:ribosomal protein S18 acetylase RimI-like enzyme